MLASSNIINNIHSQIVKFGDIKNLKKFYNFHPEAGVLPPKAFSRSRKMPFTGLFNFLLYPRSKSTDIELLEYSHLIGKPNVNKSDFSRRRRYIPWGYLRDLNSAVVTAAYGSDGILRWNGHLVIAADGTTYSIPDTPLMRERYLQGRKTGFSEQALARGVVLKDVLNDIVVAADMECYGRDEIGLLLEELELLPAPVRAMSPVVVLDRKYCAYTLLARLRQLHVDFIVRVKERFNPVVDAFIHSGRMTQALTLSPSQFTAKKLNRLYGKGADQPFRLRLVRMSADVVVMTSLDESLNSPGGTDLYHARWDDETTIGFFKNNLQVEIFSGMTDNALRQDFNAKIVLYNVLSVLCRQAATMRHDGPQRIIDRNVALGIMRLNANCVFAHDNATFNTSLQLVLTEMGRFTIPLKRHRSNPRVFRKIKNSGKYITMANYRRAI